MDEEIHNELLRRVEPILEELEKEIAALPSKQVWYCRNTEQIEELIDRMEKFIEHCYMSMSGTIEQERYILTGMIDMAEDEIKEAEGVQYSLRGRQ